MNAEECSGKVRGEAEQMLSEGEPALNRFTDEFQTDSQTDIAKKTY